MRKYVYDLNPFRDIIDANLTGFAKKCINSIINVNCDDSEDVDLVISNVEANIKSFKKFVSYIRQTKRYHTMDDFLDVDKMYCLIRYILEANTELQRNERFLRLYQSAVVNCMCEVRHSGMESFASYETELIEERDKISSYLEEILDEDGNLIQED